MTELLTSPHPAEAAGFTSEQTVKTPKGAIENLGLHALQGANSAAERGGFKLSEETEAELRAFFESIDPSSSELPLSAHGLGCASGTDDEGNSKHSYLYPGFRPVME